MPDHKTIGPMLAVAIGDSYGAGFEYADKHIGLPEYRKRNDLSRYWPHPKWGQPPKAGENYIPTEEGHYTDDMQMTFAIGELLLSIDPAEWTHGDVAGAFVGVFKRDPRPGYAQGFYSVLQKVAGSEDFLKTVRPHSQKSGGAMRAALIGLLPNPMQVVDVAMMQASLTHASRDGMNAAAGAALMFHYCYHQLGPKTDLPKFVSRWVPGPDWETPWRGRAGSPGLESVKAAMWAVISHSTLSQVLRACVNYTGDVDTVAAIAMPSAAVCKGIEHDIPQALIDGLENDAFGRDYIRDLDQKLLAKFPSKSRPTDRKTRGRGKAPAATPETAPPPAEDAPKPKDPENDSGLGLLASLFED